MNIIINDDSTLESVKQAFNRRFPYLKLEFFSKLHQAGELTDPRFAAHSPGCLGDLRRSPLTELVVSPDMSVAELEQQFGAMYGLGLQVFRKSGRSWLETAFTDDWSLRKQNEEGEFLNEPVSPDEPEDYQEQE